MLAATVCVRKSNEMPTDRRLQSGRSPDAYLILGLVAGATLLVRLLKVGAALAQDLCQSRFVGIP